MTRLSKALKTAAEPKIVTEFKTGGIYIKPGFGPYRCVGKEVTPVTGYGSVETIVFEEAYVENPNKLRITPHNAHKSGMRLPVTLKVLNAGLARFDVPYTGKTKVPQSVVTRIYGTMAASPNFFDLIDAARRGMHEFRSAWNGASQDRQMTHIEGYNRAVSLIAREYAHIKGVTVDEAKAFIEHKSGKSQLVQVAQHRGARKVEPA